MFQCELNGNLVSVKTKIIEESKQKVKMELINLLKKFSTGDVNLECFFLRVMTRFSRLILLACLVCISSKQYFLGPIDSSSTGKVKCFVSLVEDNNMYKDNVTYKTPLTPPMSHQSWSIGS